jgi:hypothetical protein
MMRLAIIVGLLAALAPNASQRPAVSALPPHDYSLVVPRGARPATALSQIRESMMTALRESRLLPAGYPQRGTTAQSSSSADANVVVTSCSELRAGSSDSTCIRLGPESYVPFGVVNHTDSRVYLFEVWPFEEQPANSVKREDLARLPRVVVGYPFVGTDLNLDREGEVRLLGALQRGLALADARPVLAR